MPALAAGPSSARLETSTPRSSLRLRALARSGMMSSPPIPRYPPLAFCTTYPCAECSRGITTCCANAADETRLTAAANAIPRLVFMALPLLLFSDKDGPPRGENRTQRPPAVHGPSRNNRAPRPATPHAGNLHGDSPDGI